MNNINNNLNNVLNDNKCPKCKSTNIRINEFADEYVNNIGGIVELGDGDYGLEFYDGDVIDKTVDHYELRCEDCNYGTEIILGDKLQ